MQTTMASIISSGKLRRTNLITSTYPSQYLIRYPCLFTAWLLLRCGADIDATDARRETPLAMLADDLGESEEVLLKLLYERNAEVIDITSWPMSETLIRAKTTASLKCLCARLIRKNGVSFEGSIGTSLAKFVEQR